MSMMTLAQRLHEKTLEAAKTYTRSESFLIACLTELEETQALAELGYSSIFTYLVKELKFTNSTAGYFFSVTKKAKVIPELKRALIDGEITVSKARHILPVLTPTEDPKPWIDKAKEQTQEQIEKEVKAILPAPVPKERLKRITAERFSVQLSFTEEEKRLLDRAKELMATKKAPSQTLEQIFTHLLKDYLFRHDPLQKAERNSNKLMILHIVVARSAEV